jgi:hypothetical protein
VVESAKNVAHTITVICVMIGSVLLALLMMSVIAVPRTQHKTHPMINVLVIALPTAEQIRITYV